MCVCLHTRVRQGYKEYVIVVLDWLYKLHTDLAWIYSGTGSGVSCSLVGLLGALSLGHTGAGTLSVKLPAMI